MLATDKPGAGTLHGRKESGPQRFTSLSASVGLLRRKPHRIPKPTCFPHAQRRKAETRSVTRTSDFLPPRTPDSSSIQQKFGISGGDRWYDFVDSRFSAGSKHTEKAGWILKELEPCWLPHGELCGWLYYLCIGDQLPHTHHNEYTPVHTGQYKGPKWWCSLWDGL